MSAPVRYGMPGPGGSLGECALCGQSFIAEILLGQTVRSFKMEGCSTELYGHVKCLTEFQGKAVSDLPPESAIRKAYEQQEEK